MAKQEEVEMVEVKIPKLLWNFLQAIQQFSKTKNTVEQLCCRLILNEIECLRGNSINEIFPELQSENLIKAYNLEKVLDC